MVKSWSASTCALQYTSPALGHMYIPLIGQKPQPWDKGGASSKFLSSFIFHILSVYGLVLLSVVYYFFTSWSPFHSFQLLTTFCELTILQIKSSFFKLLVWFLFLWLLHGDRGSRGCHDPGSGPWLFKSINSKNMENLGHTLLLEKLQFKSWFYHFLAL